ncbi:Imm40 family immunity protein [uncultured Thomasclavelia sp.]|uniref:Imm40 family immunity protein n=1 Tax=uncultured Thomasclavelia sp. TaxID=3025759 RepID=UPI00280AC517|nr:Imm40 family immunity protein [uncultured Thomasclavelia sp.]
MFDIYKKYYILSDYLDKAVSLVSMGINEVCWSYEDVKDIVDYLSKNNCVILGGDILIKKNNEFIYTYDNWFVAKNPYEPCDKKYIERSRDESIKYIDEYVMANGKEFYFVVVYKELEN